MKKQNKISKIIFITIIFFTSLGLIKDAWCLTSEEEAKLLAKVRTSLYSVPNRKPEAMLFHQFVQSTNDEQVIFKGVVEKKSEEHIDVGVLHALMVKMPSVAEELFYIADDKGLSTPDTYNRIIAIYISQGQIARAIGFYEKAKVKGKVDAEMQSKAIQLFASRSDHPRVLAVFNEMIASNLTPNSQVCSNILNIVSGLKDEDKIKVLDHLHRKGKIEYSDYEKFLLDIMIAAFDAIQAESNPRAIKVYYNKAKAAYEKNPTYFVACYNLIVITSMAIEKGLPEDTDKYFEAAKTAFYIDPTNVKLCQNFIVVADKAIEKGLAEDTDKYFEAAEAAYNNIPDDIGVCSNFICVAISAIEKSSPENVYRYFKAAEEVYDRNTISVSMIVNFISAASDAIENGAIENVGEYYKAAKSAYRQNPTNINVCRNFIDAASNAIKKGASEDVSRYYVDAEEAYRQNPTDISVYRNFIYAASMAIENGSAGNIERYYKAAEEVYIKNPTDIYTSANFICVAISAIRKSPSENVYRYFKAAEEIYRQNPINVNMSVNFVGAAGAAIKKGNFENIAGYYSAAEKAYKRIPDYAKAEAKHNFYRVTREMYKRDPTDIKVQENFVLALRDYCRKKSAEEIYKCYLEAARANAAQASSESESKYGAGGSGGGQQNARTNTGDKLQDADFGGSQKNGEDRSMVEYGSQETSGSTFADKGRDEDTDTERLEKLINKFLLHEDAEVAKKIEDILARNPDLDTAAIRLLLDRTKDAYDSIGTNEQADDLFKKHTDCKSSTEPYYEYNNVAPGLKITPQEIAAPLRLMPDPLSGLEGNNIFDFRALIGV